MTRDLAKEFAEYRILVNAVTPGGTITQERIDKLKAGGSPIEDDLIPEAIKTREKLKPLMSPDFLEKISQTLLLGRMGYPDDIAKAVLFLASDMACYITGVNITVDGGQSL